jgi:hypothetical protein
MDRVIGDLGFAVLCFESIETRRTVRSTTVVAAPEQPMPIRRFAPVVASLSVLLVAGSAAGLPTNELRPPRGAQAGSFPQDLSGWKLDNPARCLVR